MSKRVAIYLRVSTEGQADDDKYGLRRQETTCRAYAAKMGWEVVKVYSEAKTGKKIWERPVLTEVRRAFALDLFDVLLVDELGRLSREVNHQGMIFTEAERFNIQWDSATEDVDNSPQGKMVRMVMGILAEVEREKIIARTQGGLRERVKSGKLPPMPRPKFGYLWGDEKKTHFVKHEEEAVTVRLIYDLFLRGMTISQIVDELNTRGVPTSEGGSGLWWKKSVHRILTDAAYKGEFYANRWETYDETGKRVSRKRPESEWILVPDAAPPLVSAEQWQEAQNQLKTRKARSKRNNRNPTAALLRGGLIVCGYCGATLTVRNAKEDSPYQQDHDARYVHPNEARKRHGCPAVSSVVRLIDEPIWDQITDLILNPTRVEEELGVQAQQDSLQYDIELVTDHLQKLRKQHSRAVERFMLFDSDDMTTNLARAAIDKIVNQIKASEDDLNMLLSRQATIQENQALYRSVEETLHTLRGRLPRITQEQRQQLVQALGVKVRLFAMKHEPRWEGTMRLTPSTAVTAPLCNQSRQVGNTIYAVASIRLTPKACQFYENQTPVPH